MMMINLKTFESFFSAQFQGKTIMNVDIQPEYSDFIGFEIYEWVSFINQSSQENQIVFLYNGEDTLGMISEYDYQMWLIEMGVDEEVIEQAIFYDKGYAYFRYCMENQIDESVIVDLVKYMIRHQINDSRDIDFQMWDNFMSETNHSFAEVRELLENANDMISIPDLMEFLMDFNEIVLMGGGITECLKEVEIALLSLDKPYEIFSEFTY